MLAACYVGDRTVELLETEPRRPGIGEVEIDVAYTGICGTDLHIVHGAMDARVALPAVLGHEMSGSIAAVGEGIADWSVGDHVTVMPLDWCGSCPACRAGHRFKWPGPPRIRALPFPRSRPFPVCQQRLGHSSLR